MEWRRIYDYANDRTSAHEWELVEKSDRPKPNSSLPMFVRYAEITNYESIYIASRWSYEKGTWVTATYSSLEEAKATIAALITFERAERKRDEL